MLGDGLAVRLTAQRPFAHHVEGQVALGDRAHGVVDPTRTEALLGQSETLADTCFAADDVVGTDMGQAWWDNRYKFFYPPYMFQLPQAFGTLDTVATFKNIEKVYWAMKNTVNENFPQAQFIGHFSHWYEWGAMLYARFIIDEPPQDPHEAIALYNRIWDMTIRAAIKEGGVINEHHGVGLKLGRIMKDLYGPAFKVLQDMKKVLDPNNIMNPGKMGFPGK